MSSSILQQIHHHHRHLHQINPKTCLIKLPPPPPPTRLISGSTTTSFSSSELFLSSSSKTKLPLPLLLLLSRRPHVSLLISAVSNPGGDPGEEEEDKLVKEETEEAMEAVAEMLQQYGGISITRDESYEIALKSPKFIQMLIDSVRDLDDLSSSSFDLGGESHDSDATPLPFKKKVYEMGLNKGEKGMVPYLEYVGLTLPSALYLARSYLLSSSHTLLSLIPQVRYGTVPYYYYDDDDDDDDDDNDYA